MGKKGQVMGVIIYNFLPLYIPHAKIFVLDVMSKTPQLLLV